MGVFILTGMPGAGKEVFVNVAKGLGFEVRRMGDVVRAEAAKQGITSSDQGVGGFAHNERELYGYDIWAKRIVPLVGDGDTIIDGCRGLSEVKVFKNAFGTEAKVIAIHSAPSTRYPRLVSRGRYDAPKNMEEFEERDRRELGWGLGDTIALADVVMVNEGDKEAFERDANALLKVLKG
ncbi:MAG: flagellar hook-basal body complex protein FliE [Methanomassiliicoccales archaeon]|nr:flagellar hook-basal body complex protein FliE [Methanomassiliicoccales archaeon]